METDISLNEILNNTIISREALSSSDNLELSDDINLSCYDTVLNVLIQLKIL